MFQDLKKLQGQLIAEQEIYGSKSSPTKPQSARKAPRTPTGSAPGRRVAFGGSMLQSPKPDSKATQSSFTRKTDKVHQNEQIDDGISCLSSGSVFLDYIHFLFIYVYGL